MAFDLIVAAIFLIPIMLGARFGFFKMLLIFLAFHSPLIVTAALVAAGVDLSYPMSHDRVIALAETMGIPFLLIILAVAFGPRAKSAAGRVFGVLFSGGWAVLLVTVATANLLFALPETYRTINERTLTGPALLAMANKLVLLLRDSPSSFFKRERPTT